MAEMTETMEAPSVGAAGAVKKIGVVGCGLMGRGIAQIAAQTGYTALVHERKQEFFDKGLAAITKSLDKGIARGKLDEEAKSKTLANISFAGDLSDFADCDIVIEAVTENIDVKKAVFTELDGVCKQSCIFASNTSSIPISDMATVTNRRDKFVGMHFFNPVPIMKLVEIVRSIDTSEETFQTAIDLGKALGKKTVGAKDTPGFIVNVLLVPYLLDAVRQLENGLASAEEIDAAMVYGCGHPMGPLTLLDFVGLDTTLYIADIMFDEFKSVHYSAPPLLRRLVNAGYNGKKAGRGVYDYSGK
ncbi:MAG: 3-hydroxyacyl-CoA dehydrogenase family protein [Candidatus Zixiibacteriota bacterium]